MNISLQLPLTRSHSGILSKNNCSLPSKLPSRRIFENRNSERAVKFFEIPVTEQNF